MSSASIKTFIFVEFQPGETVTGCYFIGEDSSVASALQRMKEEIQGHCATTNLIILPKRHRRSYNFTHTKIDKSGPNTTYVAIIEQNKFIEACKKIDHRWQKEIDEIKKRLKLYKKPNNKVSIDNLPASVSARIKIDSGGCWLWKMAKSGRVRKNDYGRIKYKGKRWQAHRLLYFLLIGKIPNDAFIMHSCDIPACVNPDHLMPASPKQNFDDMVSKSRSVWQKE